MTDPLGHTRCGHCAALSPLYELWLYCRDCDEPVCPTCTMPGTIEDHERDTEGDESGPSAAIHWQDVRCVPCVEADLPRCIYCEARPEDASCRPYCSPECAAQAGSGPDASDHEEHHA